MYEVIRTYCTSHPVISTRQVENSISEAKNTRCMLLWAYAFFDWKKKVLKGFMVLVGTADSLAEYTLI